MTLDGDNATSSTTQRRPYSYRHKIQHAHDGPVMYPATTIPRFKKYTVNDFNFLKVLGKGSFGKVMYEINLICTKNNNKYCKRNVYIQA